jgi:hypothetical protein
MLQGQARSLSVVLAALAQQDPSGLPAILATELKESDLQFPSLLSP